MIADKERESEVLYSQMIEMKEQGKGIITENEKLRRENRDLKATIQRYRRIVSSFNKQSAQS